MSEKYKRLAINTALSALAAGVGAFALALTVTEAPADAAGLKAVVIAALYAAGRAVAGVLKASLGEAFVVDTPPAEGPDITEE